MPWDAPKWDAYREQIRRGGRTAAAPRDAWTLTEDGASDSDTPVARGGVRTRSFGYTARRGPYKILAAILGTLVFADGVAVDLLVSVLIDQPEMRALALGLHTFSFILHALLLGFLLSPLWTKHRLTRTDLDLHYSVARVRLPRQAIVTVRPVQEMTRLLAPVSVYVEPSTRGLVMAFSDLGQVELTLDRPYRVRLYHRHYTIDHILLTVDNRDAFLAALAPMRHEQTVVP